MRSANKNTDFFKSRKPSQSSCKHIQKVRFPPPSLVRSIRQPNKQTDRILLCILVLQIYDRTLFTKSSKVENVHPEVSAPGSLKIFESEINQLNENVMSFFFLFCHLVYRTVCVRNNENLHENRYSMQAISFQA